MDREKELLKQDLGNQEKPEEIKKFIEDVELLGHEDIAELGRQKLAELELKVMEVSKTSESQTSQVNELGGSNEELNKRTEDVDQNIKGIKEKAQNEIEAIKREENESQVGVSYSTIEDFRRKIEKAEGKRDYFLATNNISGFKKNEIRILRDNIYKAKSIIKMEELRSSPNYELIRREKGGIEEDQKFIDRFNMNDFDDKDGINEDVRKSFNGLKKIPIDDLIEEYKSSVSIDGLKEDDYLRLIGLVDIAKEEGNKEVLNLIKNKLGDFLPDEIKEKISDNREVPSIT